MPSSLPSVNGNESDRPLAFAGQYVCRSPESLSNESGHDAGVLPPNRHLPHHQGEGTVRNMASVRRAHPLPHRQMRRCPDPFFCPVRICEARHQNCTGSKSCWCRSIGKSRQTRTRALVVAALAKSDISRPYVLTFNRVEAYITRTRRTVRVTARWRACEAPHFSRQDSFRLRSEARGFDAPDSPGDGTTSVPGCLTGESEERETWTAESLRTAFPRGSNPPRECGRTRLRRSTFQVNTLVVKRQVRAWCESRACLGAYEQEWDLVKRCDQPGKSSLQLESLILAQSERWRQA